MPEHAPTPAGPPETLKDLYLRVRPQDLDVHGLIDAIGVQVVASRESLLRLQLVFVETHDKLLLLELLAHHLRQRLPRPPLAARAAEHATPHPV